jgi:septum formation inhibitor MinC
MKIRLGAAVVASLLLMSVGSHTVAQAASAGGSCKAAGRTIVAPGGVSLRCTQTKSGLKWRKFTPPVVVSQPATTTPVVVTPAVSVESTLLRQPGVISVNSNVVGTLYVAEVSVKVAKVSDIENAGSYLWVSAPVTKVGASEISVNINSIVNGNYRVYVANDKGVLSAASLNMVVVSMPRLYDSVAAQSWSRQFGSSDYGSNPGVAVDAVGNVYVVRSENSGVLDENFTSDVYVQKFDASGNEIASIQFGTSDGSAAATVAVDAVGNVYVAGLTRGAFAGNTSQGNNDVFVAKFNSSLVLQGAVKQFGTSEDDSVYSVVVDAVGDVYVAGWTEGAFAGYTNPGGDDGFVAKFNSSLVLQGTVKQFGTSEDDLAYSVAVDGSGNVYVAGWTGGAFAGNTSQGGVDVFVAKFNSSLVLQGTVKQFGTSEIDLVTSVAVDAAGNVYVAGWTEGAFAGSENQGSSDAFVAKFNSSLVLQDTVQFGSLGSDVATSMAVDAAGNVYVVGGIDGSFAGYTSQGNYDVFVAKFTSSLVLQGTVKQFGTSEVDLAYSVAVDAVGNVYVAGDTTGDLFGPNSGSYDTFVLKEVA